MSIMQLTQTIHILPPTYSKLGKYPTQPALPGLEPEQTVPPMVTNRQIAEVLSSIANLLESQYSNPYRIQAYRNAARGVLELQEPAAAIIARGEKLPVPGLGHRLQFRIAELVNTGTMTFYHDLCMQRFHLLYELLWQLSTSGLILPPVCTKNSALIHPKSSGGQHTSSASIDCPDLVYTARHA